MEKKALGRGLSALIQPTQVDTGQLQEKVLQIAVSKIKTNKYQPRIDFDKERLNDLINSIKEKGVIQPVLVRRTPEGYELIAGERRLRAVKMLGIENIPAIAKDVGDLDMLELSLIENIQREELNAIEEANAFQKFITDFKFTQERIGQVIGKDRSTVANTLRLLTLPRKIQDFVSKNMLTAGHARAVLSLPSEEMQLRVANLIIKRGLSVREAENLVSRRLKFGDEKAGLTKAQDPHLHEIEERLQKALGTRVKIFHGKKRGRIYIEYYSPEELNRLLALLSK